MGTLKIWIPWMLICMCRVSAKKNFRITSLLHDPDAFLIRIVADAPKKKLRAEPAPTNKN